MQWLVNPVFWTESLGFVLERMRLPGQWNIAGRKTQHVLETCWAEASVEHPRGYIEGLWVWGIFLCVWDACIWVWDAFLCCIFSPAPKFLLSWSLSSPAFTCTRRVSSKAETTVLDLPSPPPPHPPLLRSGAGKRTSTRAGELPTASGQSASWTHSRIFVLFPNLEYFWRVWGGLWATPGSTPGLLLALSQASPLVELRGPYVEELNLNCIEAGLHARQAP